MSRIGVFSAAVIAAASVLGASQAAASSVVNGSFENNTNFVANGDNTMVLTVGDSVSMPGWTVVGSPGDSIAWIGPLNPFGLTASNDGYFLDLTGYPNGAPFGGVSQSLSTLIGATYRLTFDLGSHLGSGAPVLSVSAGAQSDSFTVTPTTQSHWDTFSFDFLAGGTSTLVTLQGTGGTDYIGLDNVSVALLQGPPTTGGVPEPTTWAMMIIGFGAAGSMIRRRKAVFT